MEDFRQRATTFTSRISFHVLQLNLHSLISFRQEEFLVWARASDIANLTLIPEKVSRWGMPANGGYGDKDELGSPPKQLQFPQFYACIASDWQLSYQMKIFYLVMTKKALAAYVCVVFLATSGLIPSTTISRQVLRCSLCLQGAVELVEIELSDFLRVI